MAWRERPNARYTSLTCKTPSTRCVLKEQTTTGSDAVEIATRTNELEVCWFAGLVATAAATLFAEQRATVPDAVEMVDLRLWKKRFCWSGCNRIYKEHFVDARTDTSATAGAVPLPQRGGSDVVLGDTTAGGTTDALKAMLAVPPAFPDGLDQRHCRDLL